MDKFMNNFKPFCQCLKERFNIFPNFRQTSIGQKQMILEFMIKHLEFSQAAADSDNEEEEEVSLLQICLILFLYFMTKYNRICKYTFNYYLNSHLKNKSLFISVLKAKSDSEPEIVSIYFSKYPNPINKFQFISYDLN